MVAAVSFACAGSVFAVLRWVKMCDGQIAALSLLILEAESECCVLVMEHPRDSFFLSLRFDPFLEAAQ